MAIIFYSVIAVVLMIPNGSTQFLGNLYAFGAMLSFTLAHAAVIQMRRKMPESDMPWRGPLSYHVGGYDLPLFAVLGLIGTLASWLVTIVLHFVRRRGAGRRHLAGDRAGRVHRSTASRSTCR